MGKTRKQKALDFKFWLGPVPREELKRAREGLKFWNSEYARLNAQLHPVWAMEKEIKEAILRTHGKDSRGIVFNPAGVEQRAPLFLQRDAIAREWGPAKEARRHAERECVELDKLVRRLSEIIDAEETP